MSDDNAPRVGDLVEVVDGEIRIVTRVVFHRAHLELYINPFGFEDESGWTNLIWCTSNGRTLTILERAKPPLPTEPGIYAEVGKALSSTNLWTLTPRGAWMSHADSKYDNRAEHFGPFNRLAPVEEVLKKASLLMEGIHGCPTAAPKTYNAIKGLAAEYGVELT